MDLDPSETQELLRETVRGFLEKELPLDRVRELERSQESDLELWRALCGHGWPALPFAEAHGGAGGSLLDAGVLVEELARRAAVVPVLECLAAGRVLEAHASGPAAELLPDLLAGRAIVVPAVLEAGDRFDQVTLEARGGRLDGEKRFVDHARAATHHLVAARDGGETALFLVDARGDDVTCAPHRSIGRTPVATVRYAGVAARRVGGPEAFADLLRLGRSLAALQCVGSMAESLDQTLRYARVREQFGRPIGSFQAVQHHCANMAMRVRSARLLVLETLSALDAGQASDRQVALAKASASLAAPEVTLLAHQIHGGNGMIEENDLYFFTLRGKERSLAWGTVEECLEVVASCVHEPPSWL